MGENKLGYMQYIKAGIIFIIAVAFSVLIFALALYFIEGGYEFSPLLATISLALGGFFCSLYLGNYKGEKGILIGGAVALIVFILTALITLLVNSGAVSIHLGLRFIIILLASFIGSILGVNKKANKKFI